VISAGSCDTEDWSNDVENTALITGINHTVIVNNISLQKQNLTDLQLLNCSVFSVHTDSKLA